MTGKLYHVNFYFPLMPSDPFYIQAPNKKRLPTWCYGVAGLQRGGSIRWIGTVYLVCSSNFFQRFRNPKSAWFFLFKVADLQTAICVKMISITRFSVVRCIIVWQTCLVWWTTNNSTIASEKHKWTDFSFQCMVFFWLKFGKKDHYREGQILYPHPQKNLHGEPGSESSYPAVQSGQCGIHLLPSRAHKRRKKLQT